MQAYRLNEVETLEHSSAEKCIKQERIEHSEIMLLSTWLLSLSELAHVTTRAVENFPCLFYFMARIHPIRKFN